MFGEVMIALPTLFLSNFYCNFLVLASACPLIERGRALIADQQRRVLTKD
jgi:hypothetical protein